MKTFLLAVVLLTLIGRTAFSQSIDHWETMVQDNADWRYLAPVTDVPVQWTETNFDDSFWGLGQGGFGYGDGDDSTIVSGISVYVRHQFEVVDSTELSWMMLAIDYDDGYVAYLNGVEIARRNMGPDGTPVAFNGLSIAQHEALLYAGGTPESVPISPALLVQGTNTLAVEVHNRASTSSDLTCRPFLFVGITGTQMVYDSIPAWFTPPFTLTSQLPIVVLYTGGQTIPDDPRIVIWMGIIDNGPGNLNHLNDTMNDYLGLVNIEKRGSSSQSFPKKQYAFETQDTANNAMNVSLLGMPAENDWILHAPYSDKSLMRNYLTYGWWRAMGWYTTRTKFCEVVLNGDYQGVYILMEQIKWDKNRVDIDKLDANDNDGDSLSGGYIFKVDKTTASGQQDWISHVDTFQGLPKHIPFQYDYPDHDTITEEQQTYLQQFVYDWEESLLDSSFMDPEIGYRKYEDVNSFIDYFLIQEITKNVDGYRLSTYLNKQRDSRGGKLQAGPAWDFNITLGNANYCEGGTVENWALDFPCNQAVIPFWWHRMNQDSIYWNQLQCRWWDLRSGLFSWARINGEIDSTVNLLGDAAGRNFDRWDILSTQIWPNNYVGGTYDMEILYLKSWLAQRIQWLDSNIGQPAMPCASAWQDAVAISEINYHSIDTMDTEDWFELHNLTSDTIDLSFWTVHDRNEFNTFTLPMGTFILPDSFLVIDRDEDTFSSIFPTVENRTGSFNWGMGNDGDGLMIFDFWNDPVLSVVFDDQSPWPTAPDGNGPSLEKWDWATDLNDPASWHEGCPGGSPGRAYTNCTNVDVRETAEKTAFRLYPNPADDVCWATSEGIADLSIYNMTGEKVIQKQIGAGRASIDVSGLSAGLYLVEAVSADMSRQVRHLIVL